MPDEIKPLSPIPWTYRKMMREPSEISSASGGIVADRDFDDPIVMYEKDMEYAAMAATAYPSLVARVKELEEELRRVVQFARPFVSGCKMGSESLLPELMGDHDA